MKANETTKWKSGPAGHVYGHYKLRVHTNAVDGKGPYYTLSKAVWHGSRLETVPITFDGKPRTYEAENTAMRDLRKAKKAVEKLAAMEGAGVTSSEVSFARDALKRARTAADNAARAFDAGSYAASVEACKEAMGRLETAIANMEK